VQERGAQRLGVQAHAGADARDADRVRDEVLARLAALVGVVLAREQERLEHLLAVHRRGDLVRVLGDDREQVLQQLVLERREIVRDLDAAVVGAVRDVDRLVRRDRDDGPVPVLGDRAGAVDRGLLDQAACRLMFALVRNCLPSSSRRW
jgi:hypothetical protein